MTSDFFPAKNGAPGEMSPNGDGSVALKIAFQAKVRESPGGMASIQLRIRHQSAAHSISILANASIGELKARIEELSSVPCQFQRLLVGFPPRELVYDNDSSTLEALNFRSGESIILEQVAAPSGALPVAAAAPLTQADQINDDIVDDMQLFELREVLFGADPNETDVDRWHHQGFVFSPEVKWGLVQVQGGPCGILAPIQAWILDDLLFSEPAVISASSPSMKTLPTSLQTATSERCTAALVNALVRVFELVTLPGHSFRVVYYHCVGDQRTLCIRVPNDRTALHSMIEKELATSFQCDTGVIHFLYSILLSRGLATVRADMDDPSTPLVGQFGHCGQELVNLMLTGRAVTNVHDGDKVLGDPADPEAFRLKGILTHHSIGFLSLLEVLRYTKVGMHYKAPLHPIWVIGSTTHYTVLFGENPKIGCLSAQDTALHQAKVAFQEFDPEENGFIASQKLAALQHCTAPLQQFTLDVLRQQIDDGGVILWSRVQEFLQDTLAAANAPPAASLSEWDCPACTYHNEATAATCEMCAGARPLIASNASNSDALEHFVLHHFNGITQAVRQVSVVQVDAMMVEADTGVERGLREVLHTRWPESMIEYLTDPPSLD